MDKMKIQESLVWDKHTSDLVGFVDFGDTELNYATLKKNRRICFTYFSFSCSEHSFH